MEILKEKHGILGIQVITKAGIPIFNKTWSDRIKNFTSEDQTLIAGFMTAILSFAKSLQNKIGFIRFFPETDSLNNENYLSSYGIDASIYIKNDFVFILFIEPYIFKKQLELKIDWIYHLIFKKYEKLLTNGKKIKYSESDLVILENILYDSLAREFINKNKKLIDKIIHSNIIKKFPHEKIYGIAICSFFLDR